jgi:hypothetical protein
MMILQRGTFFPLFALLGSVRALPGVGRSSQAVLGEILPDDSVVQSTLLESRKGNITR